MLIIILSLFPFALAFLIGLALHCWARYSDQKEDAELEKVKHNEIRKQHREQAWSNMAELSVLAAYYGGINNVSEN